MTMATQRKPSHGLNDHRERNKIQRLIELDLKLSCRHISSTTNPMIIASMHCTRNVTPYALQMIPVKLYHHRLPSLQRLCQ